MKYKFNFNASEWEFFGKTILWALLLLVTFGLASPFYMIWMAKFFINNTEVTAIKK